MTADVLRDVVLPKLEGVRRTARGYKALCPAHDDNDPSLDVDPGDTQPVLFKCRSGQCSHEEILAAIGLTEADICNPREQADRPTVVAEYRYTDEHGAPLYVVKRYEPGFDGKAKSFAQYRPNGGKGIKGVRRVVYRLPEVLAAIQAGRRVWVVEGEKDADRLTALGEVATCNSGGTGNPWPRSYADWFVGADVVIVADNDDGGRKHAHRVAELLAPVAKSIVIVRAAVGRDKADVSDHLAAGYGLDDLVPLDVDQAPNEPTAPDPPPEEVPAAPIGAELVIRRLSDVAAEVDARPPRPWLFEPVWAAGDYGVMSAQDKAGKTWAILDAAISAAAGQSWLSAFPSRTTGPVLVFLGEGSDAKMIRRLRAIGAHKGLTREQVDALPILLCFRAPQLAREAHMAIIANTLDEYRPVLLIVDPLYLAAGGANGADLYAMGALLGNIQHIAQTYGASLLVAHHWNKTGEGNGHNRSSGVGPGAWGRVLISVGVLNSRTDPDTKETTVRLKWAFKGDEIAEDEHTFVRRVRAQDPTDLNSPLVYSIEPTDEPADEQTEQDPKLAGLRPSTVRVLTVLQSSARSQTVSQIGDRLAEEKDAPPLKRRTIQLALKALADRGLAHETDTFGPASAWIPDAPADAPTEEPES